MSRRFIMPWCTGEPSKAPPHFCTTIPDAQGSRARLRKRCVSRGCGARLMWDCLRPICIMWPLRPVSISSALRLICRLPPWASTAVLPVQNHRSPACNHRGSLDVQTSFRISQQSHTCRGYAPPGTVHHVATKYYLPDIDNCSFFQYASVNRAQRTPFEEDPMSAPVSLRRVLKFRTIVSTSTGLAYAAISFLGCVQLASYLGGDSAWIAILISGLLAVLAALCFSELNALYPSAAAIRQYMREAFNDNFSLVISFGYLLTVVAVVAADSYVVGTAITFA